MRYETMVNLISNIDHSQPGGLNSDLKCRSISGKAAVSFNYGVKCITSDEAARQRVAMTKVAEVL